MKKVFSLIMAMCLIISMSVQSFALTDTYVFTDSVSNTYVGQTEATDMIKNLSFTDTKNSPYQEAITRMGAFDIVKGYGDTYNPSKLVTNEEAIAFLMRSIGREKNAQQNAANLQATLPNAGIGTLWSIGYLQEAYNLGIITNTDYQNALIEDQSTLADDAFKRGATAKREDIAMWIALIENYYSPDEFPIKTDLQKVYTYSDYRDISPDRFIYVETVTANGIMNQNTTTFNPKGGVSRGELASILENLDSIYYNQNGLEKKTGTVGGIKQSINRTTGQYTSVDQYYIRNNIGKVDVIEKEYNVNISPQVQNRDVVVYKNGTVGGLSLLKEGDQIEYVVETTPNKNPNELTCLYVEVVSSTLANTTVFGKLESVDKDNQSITIRDYNTDQTKTYYTAQSMFGVNTTTNQPYMIMDQKLYDISKLPYGSGVNLHLKNNIVADVEYVGEATLIPEVRGVVVENNPDFGYMVIYNDSGKKVTYNYDIGSLQTVKKLEHYQSEDTVGYIDQVFKTGDYNPVNSTIDKIEAGDIVFIRPASDNPTYIESISASPNYTTKYGTVKSFTDNGDTVNMLVGFDNGTQSMYTFSSDIIITKEGQLITPADVVVGDNIKFLVNTAIIQPGYVIETVKEIAVEGSYSNIDQIVKGQLSGINSIQAEVQIQNAQTLEKSGWKNYNEVATYSLKNNDCEVFYNGQQINLDYANRYLKRGSNEAYVAIENSYSGPNVKRISIYDGRDTLLSPDTIVNTSGDGSFVMANNFQNISTDDGTIVVKNGKLVSPQNISPYDYAQVALNGGNKAAVVNITDKGSISGVQVARGRVQSVDEGQSFTVESMAELTDGEWVLTPVSRTFNIDNQTVFIGNNGEVQSIDDFLDYTENSVYGDVYNIISYDSAYADYVISAPYTKQPVQGTVYDIDGDTVYLKDVTYENLDTNTWTVVSRKDNTVRLQLQPNSTIVKNDKVVQNDKLEVGDQVEFYTTELDYDNMTSGMSINGYIVLVEN